MPWFPVKVIAVDVHGTEHRLHRFIDRGRATRLWHPVTEDWCIGNVFDPSYCAYEGGREGGPWKVVRVLEWGQFEDPRGRLATWWAGDHQRAEEVSEVTE